MLRNKVTIPQGKHTTFSGGRLNVQSIQLRLTIQLFNNTGKLSYHFFVLVALIGYLLEEKVI